MGRWVGRWVGEPWGVRSGRGSLLRVAGLTQMMEQRAVGAAAGGGLGGAEATRGLGLPADPVVRGVAGNEAVWWRCCVGSSPTEGRGDAWAGRPKRVAS